MKFSTATAYSAAGLIALTGVVATYPSPAFAGSHMDKTVKRQERQIKLLERRNSQLRHELRHERKLTQRQTYVRRTYSRSTVLPVWENGRRGRSGVFISF